MDWFNSDQREMDEFVASQNWYLPSGTEQVVAPSPATGSTTGPHDGQSPASTDDYNISDMEPVSQNKGKGKAAGADDDDSGPKKYSNDETICLAKIFIDVAEDPIVGNQQTGKVFWERVAEKYNARRPAGTYERSYVKLRKHWGRVQKDISKWNDKWINVLRMWPSGCSEMDLVAKANDEFYLNGKKHFKYYDIWKILQKSPKFSGGAEPAGSGAAKRTKVSASGNYSTSDGGPTIDLNQADEDPGFSSPSTQSRPLGNQKAKRKAKGKTATSGSTMPVPTYNPSLDRMADSMTQMSISLQLGHLRDLEERDTSAMSEVQLQRHNEMIEFIRSNIMKNK